MTKPAPREAPSELDSVREQLRQTQYVLTFVINQRNDALNKLADANAAIAMLQDN